MKYIKRILLLIAVIFLLAVIAGGIFLLAHKPKLKGEISLSGMETPVHVWFDDYGVPHIYAENTRDGYRAFGYLHAQDRLFQMELMKRVGAGRLAEIFGAPLASTDAFFRTIGTNRRARYDAERFDQLPHPVKEATLAYIAGVNEYIQNGTLPLEFKIIGIEPEPYTVEDLYCIAGYMAYSFALALRTDPVLEYIQSELGQEYLNDLNLAVNISDSISFGEKSDQTSSGFSISGLLDQLPLPVFQGSNSWVLSEEQSGTGKVILSNDTHIKFAAPCVWYEAHLEFPGVSIYGNFMAGAPFALTGHNRARAWGITMFEDDDSDFFTEQFASADSSVTVHRDTATAPVQKIIEVIRIKDKTDSTITVYKTANGVLINSFLPVLQEAPVSMFWNYTNIESELLEPFYALNTAKDLKSFQEGVEKIGSPGLNITYGDSAGNIALWSAGKLVKRPESLSGKTFSRGYTAADTYEGYHPFSFNPQQINPESGILITANETHANTDGEVYPGYYVPDTRFDRIKNLLERSPKSGVEEMKTIVLDGISETEAATCQEIARVLTKSAYSFSEREASIVSKMTEWDGNHQLESHVPTIYYKMLYHIIYLTMHDELGDEIFNALLNTHLFSRTYPELIQKEDSPWWDNRNTPEKKETRQQIFLQAFLKTIKELESHAEFPNMEWGQVHTMEHPHPLGTIDVLRPFFNVGPFPAPGGRETINNAAFDLNPVGKYEISYGPAMRRIINFADAENAITILPTGNSGNLMSPHYKDQSELFVLGKFRKMMMNEAEIKQSANHLIIRP